MKHIFNIVFILIATFIICYLLGSFYSVSFDIAQWSEGARSTTIFGWSLLAFIAIAGYGVSQQQ